MKYKLLILLVMAFIFLTSQIFGITVLFSYFKEQEWQPLPKVFGVGIERPPITKYNWLIFLFFVFISIIIFLLLMKLFLIWLIRVWFFLAIFISIWLALANFFPALIAIAIAMILSLTKIFRLNLILHNLAEFLIYPGLAAIFAPILTIETASLLLIALSIYDIISVLKTKHMIKMAQFQTKHLVFLGLVVPYLENKKPAVALLGGGDVALPLIFAGTAIPEIGTKVLFISIFATLALILLMIFGKKKKFYPALPVLSAGCFIGYTIAKLLFLPLA